MAIKKIRITECPYCGNKEFTEGVQEYQGQVMHTDKIFAPAHSLYHIFCTKCGSVVRSYIYEPKKLEPYDPYE